MGNISIYFKRLDYFGDSTYYHEFIVWTDDNGDKLVLRGGPRGGIDSGAEDGGGSGASGINAPGSGLDVPFGEVFGGLPPKPYQKSQDRPPSGITDPSQVIITGSDSKLRPYWELMLAETVKIDQQNVGYAFAGPNSNTFVTTVLQAAGLPAVTGNGLNDATPAPGADMSLIGGHYSAGRGYWELAENAFERGVRDVEHGILHVLSGLKAFGESLFDLKRKGPARLVRTNRGAQKLAQPHLQWSPISRIPSAVRRVPSVAPSVGENVRYNISARPGGEVSARTASGGRRIIAALGLGASFVGTADARILGNRRYAPLASADGKMLHREAQMVGGGRSRVATLQMDSTPARRLHISALPHSIAPVSPFHDLAAQLGARVASGDFSTGVGELDNVGRVAAQQAAGAAERTGVRSSDPSGAEASALDRSIGAYFMRQARLPPNGGSGFDPRVTPAWPGVKITG